MEIESGDRTLFADFFISPELDYARELNRFSGNRTDLLAYYRNEIDKIFDRNLVLLNFLPGSLVLLCRVESNLSEVLAHVAKNHFILLIANSKGREARISYLACWAGGKLRIVESEREVQDLETALNSRILELTLVEETTAQSEEQRLSEEEDPYYWFVKEMNPDEFDVPLSKLAIIPPIWQEKLLRISEMLKTNNMNDCDWSALSLMRFTRERAILSWQHYLKTKPKPADQKPSLVSYLWRMQQLMASTPLYRTNTRDLRKIIAYCEKNELTDYEVMLLSLVTPKEVCRIWSALVSQKMYELSPLAHYKYALALLKDNQGEQARSLLQTAQTRGTISKVEHQNAVRELESAETAMKTGNTIHSVKDCQQTLELLQTIFQTEKEKEFYKILVDYCSQSQTIL